ncbi:hypothetical protein AVEN_270188-1 [Araneus ventricosus]|uniref:MULE transposase domain-containing protein n=1 Tax=Araneus ventricosus TaxID=182803 RepID=A0A4Y2LY71_ARAVE|nr:hypothetical protein AVEN_270188-1 [Araneus ventricosus]
MDLPEHIRMNITNDNLPPNFENEIVESNDIVTIRCNIKSMSDINEWLKEFGNRTDTKWNSRDSCPAGEKFVCCSFSKVPSMKNKKGISKNAECLASIKVKIKLDTTRTRMTDKFIGRGLVGVITITPFHKHSLITAETLRFLPAEECREQFENYFNDGMGPAESAKYHKGVLEMNADFQPSDLANSRINPTQRTIEYWHEKWRLLNLGPRNGHGMIEKLKEKMTTYRNCNVQVEFEENPFAVAIVTPIMKRSHCLPTSKEIIFVDSTSSCDAESHSVTFMLTPCAAGAVPVGIFITKGHTEGSYKQGFRLILNILKESAFCNEGGPATFITDDSDAEISALKKTWPQSQHFLCIFHVGQAVWRWLWDSKNGIPNNYRQQLISHFQQIMYAETPACAEEAYLNAVGYVGSFIPTYPLWNEYLNKIWNRKELWCLAFRDETIRGHNTNNFSEVAIRIFKDEVLSRVKAYNVITLIDFCATTLENYYSRRLQEFANYRNAGPRLFLEKMRKRAIYSANPIKQEHVKKMNLTNANFLFEAKEKHQIAYLALGQEAPPIDFYQPFRLDSCEIPNIDGNDESIDAISPSISLLPTESHPLESNLGIHIEKNSHKKELQEKLLRLIGDGFEKFHSSEQALEKAVTRLEKITSEGQWETMLATLGSNVPLRRKAGVAIRVQPTSIARRSIGVTRGSKRVASGRPSNGSQVSKKRKHNLSENVRLNQPNAKKH